MDQSSNANIESIQELKKKKKKKCKFLSSTDISADFYKKRQQKATPETYKIGFL